MNQATVGLDICVYVATSGGIMAASEAARDGLRVAVVECGTHLGGLTTGGLWETNIGNKAAIGGLSHEFYERVFQFYAQPENWKWTPFPAEEADSRASEDPIAQSNGRPTKWTFEPHVALKIF